MQCIGQYKYNLEDEVGEGAQGRVYKGIDTLSHGANRLVAIKVFQKNKKRKTPFNELDILQNLRIKSKNLIEYLYHEETATKIFIVTEFCNGGNLLGYLDENGRLSHYQTWIFLGHIAEGLKTLFSHNVIHRDLKLENILICKDENLSETDPAHLIVKIADFGISRILESGQFADTLCGTCPYMAPEIVSGLKYDGKVDIWSFAIIAYQCIMTEHPFPEINTCRDIQQLQKIFSNVELYPSLSDEIPPLLSDLISQALIIPPAERIEIDDFFRHQYFSQSPFDFTITTSCSSEIMSGNCMDLQSTKVFTPTRATETFIHDTNLTIVGDMCQQENNLGHVLNAVSNLNVNATVESGAEDKQIGRVERLRRQIESQTFETISKVEVKILPDTTQRIYKANLNKGKNVNTNVGKAEKRLRDEHNLHFSFGRLRNENGEKFNFDLYKGDKAKNQARYEAIGEIIDEYIYELLEKEGLEKHFVSNNESEFVFSSKDVAFNEKLMILIQGSGAVRAGQWSRNLIMNESIENGSMLPCIKRAIGLKYAVLVLNPNLKISLPNGTSVASPLEHACRVWNSFVRKSRAKFICLVAHSYGGEIVSHLMKTYDDDFEERVLAIALTDSTASSWPGGKLQMLMKQRCKEWVRSQSLVGTLISTSTDIEHDLEYDDTIATRDSGVSGLKSPHGGTMVSAGTTEHTRTTLCALNEIIAFFGDRYKVFQESSN